MDSIGLNIQLLLVLALPALCLVHLRRSRLSGIPPALWVFMICAIPILGPLAYLIVQPTAESRV